MSILRVQTKLQAAGFDPGPLDGLWGGRTEAALDEALRIACRPVQVVETPAQNVLRVCMEPALAILPARMDTPEARLMMLAITGQEADFQHRWQIYDRSKPLAMGAARGLWQFERGGGVKCVLTHERTRALAANVCRLRGISATVDAVYNRLHADDVLAAAFARLLLWSSPRALPAVGQEQGAFDFYLREWRPGAWANGSTAQRETLRRKWTGYYATARATI